MVDDRRSVDHVVVSAVVENHDMILIVNCDEFFDDAFLSLYNLFVFVLQTLWKSNLQGFVICDISIATPPIPQPI